jgi:nucleoside-diphosphate-sugar epimerase
MRVLVTGATGRVGSRFVPRLIQQGEDVRVLARDAGRAELLRQRGAEVTIGDLRDADALKRAVAGVDAVIHLGASFRRVSPEEIAEVNDVATVALASEALRAGVARFVYTSTNLVLGPGRGRPAREDDPPAPPESNAYPRAKTAAEQSLRDLHGNAGLGLRIVRFAFVYGDGDPHLAESMMWAKHWAPHKRLHLLHHVDAAQAMVLALRANGIDGRIYHVGDDAPVTTAELFALNHQTMPNEQANVPIDDPWEGIVDTTLARTELGFRPIFPSVYTARDAGML